MKQIDPKNQNILVRLPNWVGDAVCSAPVLRALRAAYPSARITALCREGIASLFSHEPAIDAFLSLGMTTPLRKRVCDFRLARKLRVARYDLGLLLTHSFSSAWLFCQGGVRRKIGFRRDVRGALLTEAVPFPREKEHLVHTYQRLLIPLQGIGPMRAPRLVVTQKEQSAAHAFIKQLGTNEASEVIGIHPGAAYGSAKCWPPERFRALALRIALFKPKWKVLLFGTYAQQALLRAISFDTPKNVVSLAGQTTLRELMALLGLCKVVVTNDSGPMHIADSLGTKLVALFGSTDPEVTGPYRQRGAVIAFPFHCSPCLKRTCPIDFRCMKAISVEHVFEKVLAQLESGKDMP